MIAKILGDIAKILFVIGLFSNIIKIVFMKKYFQASESKRKILYNVHKASFGLAVVLGFIHGLLIIPIRPIYILTGWLFGITMIALMVLGIRIGFKNDWKPFNKEENVQNKKMRGLKWILTILVIILLGLHFFS